MAWIEWWPGPERSGWVVKVAGMNSYGYEHWTFCKSEWVAKDVLEAWNRLCAISNA